MAESKPSDGSSTSNVNGDPESTLQLNIKTLDSRIYKFQVDKNISILAFKEKIASQSGVPVRQQRLIFRGKLLKDDHLVSEYNVENEDTLHLVERQSQPSPISSSEETTSSNSTRGQDSAGGLPHPIGPIAHSIVLGTVNVGDPGEAAVPDLSRVIGSVLNTIGISNLTGGLQTGLLASHGNPAEGLRGDAVNENQGGNQSIPWQAFYGPSASHSMQTPLGAAVALPSWNVPVPDSLSTLVQYLNRMEPAFSPNGNQQNQSTISGSIPGSTAELPPTSHGFPTVESLSIILQHAQRLLGEHVVPAISRTAVHLNQEGGSNDPAIRGQVQEESIQLGIALQELGALFLELGRTVLTLRMGHSPSDAFVNAGPAVYISPSGPNPIMVQPFPLQTASLFGGSSGLSTSTVAMGPVGVTSPSRNVNIHIHTGATPAPAAASAVGSSIPNGEGMQGQTVNATEPAELGFQQSPDYDSISSIVAEINSQLESLIHHQGRNHGQSGQSDGSVNQGELVACGASEGDVGGASNMFGGTSNNMFGETSNNMFGETSKVQTACRQPESEPSNTSDGGSDKRTSSSKQENDNPYGSSDIPIGLGVGALQPNRRGKQPQSQSKDTDSSSALSRNQQAEAVGQQVLQSFSSLPKSGSMTPSPSAQTPNVSRGVGMSQQPVRQNADGQNDVADAMSQLLQGPALDGLLAGASQQTGVGSPDVLRNMLQQFTENPAMRNTVNQIAQQLDNHDIGSMFSSLDDDPGSGMDLSRMMQQMMPIVSGALGGISSVSDLTPPMESGLSESRSRGMTGTYDDRQIDLQEVVQRATNDGSSQEILSSLVDGAVNLLGDGNAFENLLNELHNEEGLAQELVEMLHRDVSERFHDEMGS